MWEISVNSKFLIDWTANFLLVMRRHRGKQLRSPKKVLLFDSDANGLSRALGTFQISHVHLFVSDVETNILTRARTTTRSSMDFFVNGRREASNLLGVVIAEKQRIRNDHISQWKCSQQRGHTVKHSH